MLRVYTRHYPPCPQTNIGYRRCHCPKWINGLLPTGEFIRISARTRSWENGERKARLMEMNADPWVVPFAASTALLMNSDQSVMSREHSSASAIKHSDDIANGGTAALAGLSVLMYGWGSLNGDDRAKETGLLSGEALINSFAVAEALKTVFGRERPTITDGKGNFFQNFSDGSFPSTHSMLSWTAASVIAHEYPGWLSQTLAYGTASAVSISRVTGRKHFPSDVAVGGVLGWLIGRQTYNRHHDSELDDVDYGTFVSERHRFEGPQTGATYVPIDSWVYPEFDRLEALGYISTAETGTFATHAYNGLVVLVAKV